MVLPVVAELPLCRLFRPPLMRLRILPCRCIDAGAGDSGVSCCLGGDTAPADNVVRDRGRSFAVLGGFSVAYAAETACAAARSSALAEASSGLKGRLTTEDMGLGSVLSVIPS